MFLLIEAAMVLVGIRLGLWLLPLRRLRQILVYFQPAALPEEDTAMEHVIWAVEAAGRYLPDTSCLTRALAAQLLLARRGHHAQIQIGFTRAERVRGHAWVECKGRVVLGRSDGPYIRLLSFE